MARTYNSGHREWFNYAHADISKNFMVEGLTEQMAQLDALLSTNPDMEKRMQNVIRKVLTKAQKQMSKDIASDMPNDPRHAAKAVRKLVYRQLLGGNINILRKTRATAGASTYTPTRTLKSGQRGGNRRLRSERTHRMDSYNASDRGFILFWLNSGTDNRQERGFRNDPHRSQVKRGSQGGDVNKYGKTVNTGARGNIASRNVFASNIIALGEFIDQELNREFADLLKSQV